jgi:hypothetical protein
MSDLAEKGEGSGREIVMTPTQLNEVIVQKLAHLKPEFERVLRDMKELKDDLSNGKIHWKTILDRARLNHDNGGGK